MTVSTLPRAPGLRYVLRGLPKLCILPLSAVAFAKVLQVGLGIKLSTWACLLALLLLLPLAFTVNVQYAEYTKRRDAKRLGAILPPRVKSTRPGSFDLLRKYKGDKENKMPGYRHFEWLAEYGSIVNLRLFFNDRYITSEPEYIKRVLATDFTSFEKGSELQRQFSTLLGTGVFNSDGEMWKFHRGVTRPFFSKDRISHFDIFDKHADAALSLAKSRLAEGFPIDWQDLVSRFTMDSATSFLFGADVRSLAAGLPYPPTASNHPARPNITSDADSFAQSFMRAQLKTARRGRFAGAWPLAEFWKDKVEDEMNVIDAFVKPIVDDALRRKAEKAAVGEKNVEDETLLGHLVELTDDPTIIKDETLNILIAGRDTTASLLTSAVYMLSEHPDVCARLRDEILERVGMRRPTYEDIRDMKYLRAFINETLRLYPPVPFNVRYSTKASVWPSTTPGNAPLYIPAHTRVLYSVFVMHRRTDLWGPDAAEFDPDRFLDARLHRYLTPNPMIFLPFNAGPRICLGQQFAYNEASFMLIRLLQQFAGFTLAQAQACPRAVPTQEWAQTRGSNGKDRVKVNSHLTMFVEGGLWVRMEEA